MSRRVRAPHTQPPAHDIPERAWLACVRDLAAWHGYAVYHTWLSARSAPGFPDLVLSKPGRPVLFVELKRQAGVLTPAQVDWLARLAACPGCVVCVWRPSDYEAARRILAGEQGWPQAGEPLPTYCPMCQPVGPHPLAGMALCPRHGAAGPGTSAGAGERGRCVKEGTR
jgi:hypothetical protein